MTAEATSGLHRAADESFFDRIFGVKTAYAAAAFTVTAVTDANGIATFANLPPGNYKFTVTNSGKEMKSLAVAVPDGSTSNATVVLPASGGNCVAMISDAVSEAAINGAAVELKSGSTVIETKTAGSDGTVAFSGLTAGSTYTVTAGAGNYASKSINTTVTDKETVAAAIALTPLTPQTGSVTLTVRDQNQTGTAAQIEGATVTVTGSGISQGVTRTVQSDSTGNVAFSALPTGSYTFSVTKAGYTGGSGTFAVINAWDDSQIVRIVQSFVDIGVYVKEYAESGPKPMLGGVTVTITNGAYSETQTATAGVLMSFYNVPVGNCTFTLTKSGYTTITQTRVMPDEGTAPIFIMYKN